MNEQNLRPFKAGEDRAKEAGRRGGVASGEAKKERFRQLLLAELDAEATRRVPPQKDALGLTPLFEEERLEPAGYTVRAALAKALIAKAEAGDLKALDMVLRLTEAGDGEDAGAA